MTIKVLGAGCAKCKKLEETVRDVLKKNNITADVQKVSQIEDIMQYGIMTTPGLVINEKVKSSGSIPKEDAILQWIKEAI